MGGRRVRTKAEKKKAFKKTFLTSRQARQKLQISQRDFRRICILKGVYPREPKSFDNSSGKGKTYFATKDISWIMSDPALDAMRTHKTFKKKLTNLLGRRELVAAKRLEIVGKPELDLKAIIKERYPTFGDALRDLDDALCHIFLYSVLPPLIKADTIIEGHRHLTTGQSTHCKELVGNWNEYIIRTNSLRKVFVSIKGFYYQAEISGETVTWLVPFEFTTKMPNDVDYGAMISFLDFYITFLGFVLFKLNFESDKKQKISEELQDQPVVHAGEAEVTDFPENLPDATKQAEQQRAQTLFKGLRFFIGRETPLKQLDFVIRAFGGTITENEDDISITHQVIDRPVTIDKCKHRASRDYVQPQWVFDSINARQLLLVENYHPGKALPPHLSPFGDPNAVTFDNNIYNVANPTYATITDADKTKDESESDSEDALSDEEAVHEDAHIVASDTEDEDEDEEEEEPKKEQKGKPKKTKEVEAPPLVEKQLSESAKKTKKVSKDEKDKIRAEREKKMKIPLMSAKNRSLYRNIQYGVKRKNEAQAALTSKRQRLADGQLKVNKKGFLEDA